jgi:predicted aspartyl protease
MKTQYNYMQLENGHFPLIPVMVKAGNSDYHNIALIDSGASFSVFQKDAAHSLGLRIEEGSPILVEGAGGLLQAYVHRLTLKVAENEFLCDICFSEQYSVRMNLLGRKDFFEKFLITFDEKNRKFFLETNE